ncbi:MAG: hypothetical protein GY751_17175 [Bacteroidetes bacterium]|nr:hypothetical protein [Bacteroidota bacterium]
MILYKLILRAYWAIIRFVALLGYSKARKILAYQRQTWSLSDSSKNTIWIHVASAGEGNQALPLVPDLRKQFNCRIIISFFSPSGYDFHKGNKEFDDVLLLPPDVSNQASAFIDQLKPSFVLLIRNELWLNYLDQLRSRNIPVFLVNTPVHLLDHPPFYLRNYLSKCFNRISLIFPTVKPSTQFPNLSVNYGDTKWQVKEAGKPATNEHLKRFCETAPVIIIGSSWQQEESILKAWLKIAPSKTKLIIAPHENSPVRLQNIQNLFPDAALYSKWKMSADASGNTLILDEYGLLKNAYQYADIAVIGGGFGKGIHNILEPASYGLPVLFGPNHQKFCEAGELAALGFAFHCVNKGEIHSKLSSLLEDPSDLDRIRTGLLELFKARSGYAAEIVKEIALNLSSTNP